MKDLGEQVRWLRASTSPDRARRKQSILLSRLRPRRGKKAKDLTILVT
jgi:hypothetical protein